VGRPPKPTDPIFPGPDGDFCRPRAGEHLRQDLRTAGCPDTCHGHPIDSRALRRSFSTWLDAEEVRGRLMGHARRSVTAKHYTDNQVETDRRWINRIALRWGPPGRLVAHLVADVVAPPPKPDPTIRLTLRFHSGAPETTRTSDQRFRKAVQSAAIPDSYTSSWRDVGEFARKGLAAIAEGGPGAWRRVGDALLSIVELAEQNAEPHLADAKRKAGAG
jgi:hypothetical protein